MIPPNIAKEKYWKKSEMHTKQAKKCLCLFTYLKRKEKGTN